MLKPFSGYTIELKPFSSYTIDQQYQVNNTKPFSSYTIELKPFNSYTIELKPFSGYTIVSTPFSGYTIVSTPFSGYTIDQQHPVNNTKPFSGYTIDQWIDPFSGGSVVVWGCVWHACKLNLVTVQGNLNGPKYQRDTLETIVASHFGHETSVYGRQC